MTRGASGSASHDATTVGAPDDGLPEWIEGVAHVGAEQVADGQRYLSSRQASMYRSSQDLKAAWSIGCILSPGGVPSR